MVWVVWLWWAMGCHSQPIAHHSQTTQTDWKIFITFESNRIRMTDLNLNQISKLRRSLVSAYISLCVYQCVCVSDVDECAVGSHTCDVKAECYNTIGSFKCVCTSGFSGTGHRCLGIYSLFSHYYTNSDWRWRHYWKLFPLSLGNIARCRRRGQYFPNWGETISNNDR